MKYSMEEIKGKVDGIVCDYLELELDNSSYKRDISLAAQGLDSLSTYEVLMDLEKEFEIEITNAEIERVTTPEDIYEYLKIKLNI